MRLLNDGLVCLVWLQPRRVQASFVQATHAFNRTLLLLLFFLLSSPPTAFYIHLSPHVKWYEMMVTSDLQENPFYFKNSISL